MTDMQTAITAEEWGRINAAVNQLPYSGLLGAAGIHDVNTLVATLTNFGQVLSRVSDKAQAQERERRALERELGEYKQFVTNTRGVFDVFVNGGPVTGPATPNAESPTGVAEPYTGPVTPLKD